MLLTVAAAPGAAVDARTPGAIQNSARNNHSGACV